jgi:hypothetical protein
MKKKLGSALSLMMWMAAAILLVSFARQRLAVPPEAGQASSPAPDNPVTSLLNAGRTLDTAATWFEVVLYTAIPPVFFLALVARGAVHSRWLDLHVAAPLKRATAFLARLAQDPAAKPPEPAPPAPTETKS